MTQSSKFILFAVLTILTVCIGPAQASENTINENQARAAFVFNVSHYVSWPLPQGDVFIIGIFGKGSMEPEWKNLTGKTLNGRNIRVVKSADIDELLDCQIVFFEENSHKKISRALMLLRNTPALTIGQSPVFIASGGMLNLSLINSHISFAVNLANLRSSGLIISSNLLKLASEVIK